MTDLSFDEDTPHRNIATTPWHLAFMEFHYKAPNIYHGRRMVTEISTSMYTFVLVCAKCQQKQNANKQPTFSTGQLKDACFLSVCMCASLLLLKCSCLWSGKPF